MFLILTILFIASEDAKKLNLGLYNEGGDISKHVRKLIYSNTPEFDADAILKKANKKGKPYRGIVEYVFSPNALNVYIEDLSIVTRVNINHIYTPAQEREATGEAKELVEKLLLNRICGVVFQKVDDKGNLVARILHKNGNIDEVLVKKGLSKILVPQDEDYDKDHYKKLRDAQDIAQINQEGLWKALKNEESKKKTKSYDPTKKDFDARIVEVHSGDSITILPEGGEPRRVFLASIKAPAMAKNESDDHEPWAWESKEFVRRQVIGKKVKVEMEFQREIEIKKGKFEGQKRQMEFATIFVGGKNLSELVLERGYAKTSLSKFKEENSKYFENLIAADTKASNKKAGVHSNKEAKIYRFIDTSKNTKAARTIYSTLTSKSTLYGVVEFTLSGQKFKIRLDDENCSIGFGLIGINIPQPDNNQPGITDISDKAKEYAKHTLHQKDVAINVKYIDKRGTFLGNLWLYDGQKKKKGENYAAQILRKGYGNIQDQSADKLGKLI